MADLTTPEQIDAELAATADYLVTKDVEKAKRRAAALERKLDFPEIFGLDGDSTKFALQHTKQLRDEAIAFVRANETRTDADRINNPDVIHADFSTFRGYG
jgi:hypothetical protein